MNKVTKNLMKKTKLNNPLNANEKSLAEFYKELISAMYFRILG